MKRYLWWGIGIVLVLLVLAVAGWWIWGSARGTLKVTAGTVAPISMQEDVYATGSVAPGSRQEVRVLNPGIVSKVAVKVGDTVQAGQTLATLDTTLADAQVAQTQAGVEAAQAVVNAAQNSLAELKRAQSLAAAAANAAAGTAASANSGSAGQSNMDVVNINGNGGGSAAGTNNNGAANVGSLTSVLEGSGAVSQAQGALAQGQAALKQAQEALHLAQIQRDLLSYKAILSGTVLEVNAQAGDLASAQQPLVVVGELNHMNVVVQLNEMDANKVKRGEKVTVTSKTLGTAAVTGIIAEIAPEAATQASLQANTSPTVGVTIRLDQVPAGLKPGYNVNIQVVVATKKGVLAVPLEALFQEGSKNYVYRIQEGRLHKTEVKVGIGNDTHQEITSGLKSGDLIVLNPSNQLSEGLAVTAEQGSGGS
ncbi:efflux RND transporter periplasmic adaptor subunit [Desulfosporosinus sp. PR]|uniref:efflux RND transporter periplasmic adaptor subunit n=1 Tax=Candidatus Desulfosporosinus nitrosoreducens TaxID=3401928 RepID=UPI0027EFEE82|nr:efflux RND transporter periplasmic adaptor subunit [Desulfosporosinus sp. PR]MDQ7096323.1 efflux RND transporter periplasmic adaptor subunit [Desulfosporosinus sp. PR]